MRMNKQGHYVRDGVDLEVIVDRKASYEEVIEKACNAFSMEKGVSLHCLPLEEP